MTDPKRTRSWVRLVACWAVCGAVASADVIPRQTAAESYTEVKRYAYTLLHFQRMQQLQESAVQQLLQLSSPQIQTFRKEGAEAKRMIGELQTIPAADRETTIERKFVPKAKQYRELIDGELSEEQSAQLLRRVAQQQRGAIALLLPGIPEHLELTDKQQAAICRIVDENRKAFGSENISGRPLELIKLTRRVAQSRSAAEDCLTADQKSRWSAYLKDPLTK